MPDISMCNDAECPSRNSCYRYQAAPTDKRQAYGNFNHGTKLHCDFYWKISATEESENKDESIAKTD